MDSAPSEGKLSGARGLFGRIPFAYVGIAAVWLVSILIIVAGFLFLNKLPAFRKFLGQQEQNTWIPYSPSPAPLATGKQTYKISGGKKGAPYIVEAEIDPIDPKDGQTQTVTLRVVTFGTPPAQEVSVTLITDNKTKTNPLTLSDGTAEDGHWKGSWQISDTYLRRYQAVLKAKNADNLESQITLTFR